MFTTPACIHDGRRVLTMGSRNGFDHQFVVGDLETGETLFALALTTPHGEIAVSDDGMYAVVIDEADALFERGTPAIHVVDLVHNRLLPALNIPAEPRPYWPGQVRFLPGDRRVVICPPNVYWHAGWIQTFDLVAMTIEVIVESPYFEPMVGVLAVGPRPPESR